MPGEADLPAFFATQTIYRVVDDADRQTERVGKEQGQRRPHAGIVAVRRIGEGGGEREREGERGGVGRTKRQRKTIARQR